MQQVSAETLGQNLANRFLDPEICQREADALRPQPRPDPVGCCEVAFARAALLKFVVTDTQPAAMAARIIAGIDSVVTEMFKGVGSPETAAWYGPGDLSAVAMKAIDAYYAAAFWSDRVAKTMADRLGLQGPSAAIAKGFTEMTEAVVVAIMKVKIR